jgi:hypothetical protein
MRITIYAVLVLAILFTLYSTTEASPIAKETTQTNCDNPKSKMITFILSLLVGSLGVDRFYTGFIALGVIKAVITFCSCGKKK